MSDAAKKERYKIMEILAERQTAIVYRAHDTKLDRTVAMKGVKPGLIAEKPHYRDVFMREARYLAQLDHPNVVPLYEFYDSSNGPVLVMRFAGSNLEQLRRARNDGVVASAGRFALEIASALDYCASQGIAHRDVKPDNLLLGAWEDIYLADFGIAAPLDENERWAKPEGAKAFLSPEMFTDRFTGGKPERRQRADQFSFGVTLYYILSSSLPHDSSGNTSSVADPQWKGCTAYRLLRGDPVVPCSHRNPTLPIAVDTVLSRTLSIDPEDRYRSNLEAATALNEALEGRFGEEARVFVTYARQDEILVKELIDGLTKAGFKVFWDRMVDYGTYWDDRIEQAMEDSDIMLVILSPRSASSIEVKNEWRYWASYLKRPLITIVLEECRIPYRLFSRQHIRAEGRPIHNLLAEVTTALRKIWRSARFEEPAQSKNENKSNDYGLNTLNKYVKLGDLRLISSVNLNDGADASTYIPARYRSSSVPADIEAIVRNFLPAHR